MELTTYSGPIPPQDRQGWLTVVFNEYELQAFQASHQETSAIKLSQGGQWEHLDVEWARVRSDQSNYFHGTLPAMERAASMLMSFSVNTPKSITEICEARPPFFDTDRLYLRRYDLGRRAGAIATELRTKLAQVVTANPESEERQWRAFLNTGQAPA